MGAKVQTKTFFSGSMMDLNNSFHNGVRDPYHDDRSHRISNPVNSQQFDYFLTSQAMDGYNGYGKEQIKQTILKHETIFRHQLQELHRLYKRQRDLMNPVATKMSQFGSDIYKERPFLASNFSPIDSSFSRASTSLTNITFSPVDSIKGKTTFKDFNPEVDTSNKRNVFSLADLNEPIHADETAFATLFYHKNRLGPQKKDSSAKRTLFGVDISERNHAQSFVSPWKNTNSSVYHNNWPNSSNSTSQNTGLFTSNSRLTTNPVRQTSFSFEDRSVREKNKFLDMWKNETPVQTLPHWLTPKPCLPNEHLKSKQTSVHHINLNSLQNDSHLFFKKTEMKEGSGTHVFKKVKTDENENITKILGVPIVESRCESKKTVEENGKKKHVSDIDLNLSLDEEDVLASLPESVVKIATMEIDLEAPAVLESDTDPDPVDGSMDNTHLELVNNAAEAIVSISRSEPSADKLLWFAEVITSTIKEMDYFEYMTLQLEEETEEVYDNYKPIKMEDPKEETSGSLLKRTRRIGQGKRGRQKRDFQKDILPSIVSLSRREVTEDLQIFEEALSATGVSWQSNWTKRKSARGRRRLVVADTLCDLPPPSTPPSVAAAESICRELSLEKNLGGWGRRTRRLPRQRCKNGGKHNSSPVLKC
ncbi:uncharacterized protein [Rutidosis leptorrhynchoides]|uniref:uncharacterized protein n=1 Tax=Rutidosis leptorrhynchoides TaxID=125765 RepID=UPI003A99FEA5